MKQFTVELDDTVCVWLEHISALTNEPAEQLIANSIYNQIAAVEAGVVTLFTYDE